MERAFEKKAESKSIKAGLTLQEVQSHLPVQPCSFSDGHESCGDDEKIHKSL